MTDSSKDGIEVIREFAAPPAAVFAAWTAPESFAQWFGGRDVHIPADQLNYRAEEGSIWSATMVLPDGNTIKWTGEFLVVAPPKYLVMTITDQPANEQRAKLSVDLSPTPTGTELRMTQQTPGFSDQQRAATIAGWQGFLDVLAAIAEK